jgi:hypothetical protein
MTHCLDENFIAEFRWFQTAHFVIVRTPFNLTVISAAIIVIFLSKEIGQVKTATSMTRASSTLRS